MKKVLMSALTLLAASSAFGQTNIADARTYSLGQTVTVVGVATNGSELGSIRYMQDGTAGIAGYGGPITGVNLGDSIAVTGPLIEFSGLLEISTVTNVVNYGPATVQPSPLLLPITSAGEVYESQYVQFDNVTFVQTGNFNTGNGTYQVTDGTNTLDVRVNGSTNIDGTPIPTGAISIRGLMGQFNANYQVVPRSLSDIFPYVAPAREINVLINGTTVLTGSTVFIGNSSTTNVTIENTGSNNLTITGSSFSGTNMADFSSTITAGTIGSVSNQAAVINYTPGGPGSRFATLSIGNDDSDENPYIINIEAVGTNGLATEPTANPTGLTFPVLEPYTLGGQYTAGSGASKYLVLWKKGSPITGVPVDGNTYLRGDIVGDAKVAYNGAGTTFTPRGVWANENYYFAVYAYNGSGGFENYLTTSPLTGNVTSLGENIGNYYNGIDKNATTFVSDLGALINPHTSITYFQYKQTVMAQFEVRDTTAGQSFVTCALSGENKVFNGPFDWTPTGYSREHTFAHSWMPTFPADNPEQPEYNDQHNLYPANLDNANTPRSNLPLDDIDGNVVFTYLEGRVGYSGSQLAYEPRDKHKGNAARSIMYMAVAYDFDLNGNVNSTKQRQQTLKNWHFNDLPDNYEIARHEYIYDLQGNRNPFIDSVDYACYIDFDNNAHIPEGCDSTNSLTEKLANNFVVFPVPSDGKVFVQVNGTDILSYALIDMQGRVVLTESNVKLPVLVVDGKDLESGSYIINVETPYGNAQQKLIIK